MSKVSVDRIAKAAEKLSKGDIGNNVQECAGLSPKNSSGKAAAFRASFQASIRELPDCSAYSLSNHAAFSGKGKPLYDRVSEIETALRRAAEVADMTPDTPPVSRIANKANRV